MIEFQEPIPKRFPPKARCQPLPIIVGDLSEDTIKNLWPCYIGVLKSNRVVITDGSDMKNLHNAGFFGQSASFDRKKAKQPEHSVKPRKRRKNWDQLIISNSVPNLDACLSDKSTESTDILEGDKIKPSSERNADQEMEEPQRNESAPDLSESAKSETEPDSSKISLSTSDFAERNEDGKGITLDVSDSEEEDVKDESTDIDPDDGSMELDELIAVKDLDSFSDDSKVLNLHFEEAFFLSYALGCLTVLTETEEMLSHSQQFEYFSKTDENFVHKYVAYHYFRSKGWIVKPGIKFGGDFLLYKQGPPYYHASFIIMVDKGEPMTWTTVMGLNRLAGSVNKELIIASVSIPGQLSMENMLSASVTETLYRRWVPSSEVAGPGH